jgi:hypothetical protein
MVDYLQNDERRETLDEWCAGWARSTFCRHNQLISKNLY